MAGCECMHGFVQAISLYMYQQCF